ncbi:MAG: hypothetical protein IKO41_02395 [Lachnospiraceae bacterium]|nr:hypothetical protein [Lachnospiraceae bacterium]
MRKLLLAIAMLIMLGGCSNPIEDLDMTSGFVEGEAEIQRSMDAERRSLENNDNQVYDDYFLVSGTRFAYQSLSSAQKLWYEDMEHILGSMAEEGKLSKKGLEQGLTEKDIEHVFSCVCMDHPELFYVEGYSYSTHLLGDEVIGYSFSGNYGMDRATAVIRLEEIKFAAQRIQDDFAFVWTDGSDYEKVKYVYETLIRDTEYDLNAPDNQTIYSALVGKRSVCQGYAKSMQYLLNAMGLECTLIQGTAPGEPHGWNLVKSDGEYYYGDATWGDNSYRPENGGALGPEILYEYLCVTTEEILKEHQIDEIVPLPMCTATKDNYFVREGALFTEVDQGALRILFGKASAEDRYQVSLKCATRDCYEAIIGFLLDQNKIFDYYPTGGTRISYYQNEDMLCLTFWVTN